MARPDVPSQETTSQKTPRPARGILPPEIVDLLGPPLKVGVWSGSAGVLAGIGGAIAADTSPVVGGVLSGANWFTLATSFCISRSVLVRRYGGEEHMKGSQKTAVSALSGAVAGTAAGLLRTPSPRLIFQNSAMFGITATAGQLAVNYYQSREPRTQEKEDSWLLSKISPLKKLSNSEYEDLMHEKILKVETEIALIDDRITELRTEAKNKTK